MTLMSAAHTLAYFAHAMEVRPNSHPEKTGRAMTGTLSDGTVVDAAFVDGILGRANSIDRLITKRTLRLADDRESLKDRLHSYIELRSVTKWRPPTNMSYLTFADRLKSFATWPRRTELTTPESLAEAGFYYEGMYILFYNNFYNVLLDIFAYCYYHAFFITHRAFR